MLRNYKNVWLQYCIIALILLFFVGIYQKQSIRFFWLDEITTLDIATISPASEIVFMSKIKTGQPALFYLAGHYWIELSQSTQPQVLRLLPFVFFLGSILVILWNIKESLVSMLLLFVFTAQASFSEYLLSEFRPYSLSFFLYSLAFTRLRKISSPILSNYTITTLILLLFSATLSLNIPLGIMSFLLLSFLVFAQIKLNQNIANRIGFSLLFTIFLSSFIYLLYYMFQHDPRILPFDSRKYAQTLSEAYYLIRRDMLNNKNLELLGLALAFLYFKVKKLEKSHLILLSFLFIVSIYQIFFPTYVLYNRIDGYSTRYAHLIFLIFPLILITLSDLIETPDSKSNPIWQSLLILSLFFYFSFKLYNNAEVPKDLNGERSEWLAMFKQTRCSADKTLILLDPPFIDRIGKYHFKLSKNPLPYFQSLTNRVFKSESMECVFIVSINKISEDSIRLLNSEGFSLVEISAVDMYWPQDINYIAYLKK